MNATDDTTPLFEADLFAVEEAARQLAAKGIDSKITGAGEGKPGS